MSVTREIFRAANACLEHHGMSVNTFFEQDLELFLLARQYAGEEEQVFIDQI